MPRTGFFPERTFQKKSRSSVGSPNFSCNSRIRSYPSASIALPSNIPAALSPTRGH